MAEVQYATGFAIGVQSAFGTPNATIAGLAGALTSADGIVLGDKESGDAESGITFPDMEPIFREAPVVADSLTEQADFFQRLDINSFSIAVPVKGNGATTTTPAAGEAVPLPGLDAIWQSAGLIGVNAVAPKVDYTPRINTDGITLYSTVKLWLGGGTEAMSFVFTDCLVDTGDIVFTPGGNAILTANFAVGKHDPVTDFASGLTLPTFDYTTQSTLAAPTIEGVNFSWGGSHPGAPAGGFENLTINIENTVEEFGDSNVVTTGIRQNQTRRQFLVSGALYIDDTDTDFDYQNVVDTNAPIEDLTFSVGTPAGATAEVNAFNITVALLQGKGLKYNRIGTALVAEIANCKATNTVAGAEFTLVFE